MPLSEKFILSIAIPIPVDRLFDYLPLKSNEPHQLKAGMRIQVPFGTKSKVGILIAIKAQSDSPIDKLKQIEAILDTQPLLGDKDLELLHWCHRYYHYPIGDIFMSAFPTPLRKGKPSQQKSIPYFALTEMAHSLDGLHLKNAPKQRALFEFMMASNALVSQNEIAEHLPQWQPSLKALLKKQLIIEATPPKLSPYDNIQVTEVLTPNQEQAAAIQEIQENLVHFSVYLLEGITGSGKTEVYLQLIQQVLANKLQVLVLLPEITLTPQLEARFKRRFNNTPIETYHSKQTETQRQSAWMAMQKENSAILLGTRSALFTPCPHLGLIILDEEHDSSFKQQEGFRFSARDIAIMRAKILNIPIILGSATPSLESLYNAEQGRYHKIHLRERAGNATPPQLSLFDIRNQYLQEGLSPHLIKVMRDILVKKEQILLFLNRRGYSPTLICHSCGWTAQCQSCDSNMVIHHQQQKLRCHHCAKEKPLLKQCPKCHNYQLKPLGLGTERVEQALTQLFPQQTVVRLDRDSTQRKGSLESHLQAINSGQVDIILGTQMLAKGHHFPNVTLVALLDVDSGLFSIDFHAAEKLAQLITQVAGRAGREQKKGHVILQTRQPEHPLLNQLIHQGYATFAETALAERKEALLPPYSYQALLRASSLDTELAFGFLNNVVELIMQQPFETMALGPVPAPMPKRAGHFRYQLLLQNAQRKPLHLLLQQLVPRIYALKSARKVKWSLDIDPIDLY